MSGWCGGGGGGGTKIKGLTLKPPEKVVKIEEFVKIYQDFEIKKASKHTLKSSKPQKKRFFNVAL